MASHYEAPIRRPLIIGDKSYHDITVEVAAPVEGKANKYHVEKSLKVRNLIFTYAIMINKITKSLGCKHC